MRYHWGLAIGHLYTHHQPRRASNNSTESQSHFSNPDLVTVDSDAANDSEAQGLGIESAPPGHDESGSETSSVLQTTEHEFLVNARDDNNWDSVSDDGGPLDEEPFSEGEDSDVEMLASVDE
jgi:hypothetical protein